MVWHKTPRCHATARGQEASDALNMDMAKLCFETTRLGLTGPTQPAIVTAQSPCTARCKRWGLARNILWWAQPG